MDIPCNLRLKFVSWRSLAHDFPLDGHSLSAGTCWNTTESMRFSEPKEPKGPEA